MAESSARAGGTPPEAPANVRARSAAVLLEAGRRLLVADGGAGRWVVRAHDGSWRTADVEVRSGETTELELAFEPSTER